MKTAKTLLAVVAAALIGTGCSTMRTHYDYDPSASFSRLKRYDFAAAAIPEGVTAPVPDPILDQRVRQALEKNLAAKGYLKTEAARADFRVVFVVTMQRYVVMDYWGGWGWASAYPRTYEEGALVLTIVEAASQKTLWRGSVSDALGHRRDPEARQASLDAAVRKLLEDFPPKGRP